MNLCDSHICTGCGACVNTCPVACIQMKRDAQGFDFPEVEKEQCIGCGACTRVCPQLSIREKHSDPEVFMGGGILSENEMMRSTSGGMGYALAKHIIEEGGIVFGVSYNENMQAVHIGIERREKLYLLQGSKYTQSFMGNAMKEAKKALDAGRKVLFFGVGCQIDGFLSFLGNKDYPNLITCDLLCGGGTSPGVFEHYIQMLSEKYRCNIVNYNFRDKYYGYGYLLCSFKTAQGGWRMLSGADAGFIRSMGKGYVRESCFNCKYAETHRMSDISLGDFWGEKSKEYQNIGTSLILANTEKGKKVLKALQGSGEIWLEEKTIQKAVSGQAMALNGGKKKPDDYDAFFSEVFTKNWGYVYKKHLRSASIKSEIVDSLPVWMRGLLWKVQRKLS